MASKRQNEANRSNAARSTGPKTAGGKATSSRNALRHGLARRCKRDNPELNHLMVAVRSGLGPELGSDAAAALARDLVCVRMVRHAMLADLSDCLVAANVRRLQRLERYERSALAMQTRALRSLRTGEG
jgi:hypothetical protein